MQSLGCSLVNYSIEEAIVCMRAFNSSIRLTQYNLVKDCFTFILFICYPFGTVLCYSQIFVKLGFTGKQTNKLKILKGEKNLKATIEKFSINALRIHNIHISN